MRGKRREEGRGGREGYGWVRCQRSKDSYQLGCCWKPACPVLGRPLTAGDTHGRYLEDAGSGASAP